jgi:hypothetical protein
MDTVNRWRCGEPQSWIRRSSDGREEMGFLFDGQILVGEKNVDFLSHFLVRMPSKSNNIVPLRKNRGERTR